MSPSLCRPFIDLVLASDLIAMCQILAKYDSTLNLQYTNSLWTIDGNDSSSCGNGDNISGARICEFRAFSRKYSLLRVFLLLECWVDYVCVCAFTWELMYLSYVNQLIPEWRDEKTLRTSALAPSFRATVTSSIPHITSIRVGLTKQAETYQIQQKYTETLL